MDGCGRSLRYHRPPAGRFTWEVCEAFKIEHGLIRWIEAVFTQAPYGMRPNWPESGLGYDPRWGPR